MICVAFSHKFFAKIQTVGILFVRVYLAVSVKCVMFCPMFVGFVAQACMRSAFFAKLASDFANGAIYVNGAVVAYWQRSILPRLRQKPVRFLSLLSEAEAFA